MKLDELLGVKKFYDKHLDDVKKAFVGKGSLYKKLGAGATATAYAHGEEYVYKFWVMDTAYEKYVDYCLDNQDNPHVPVLYSDIKNLHSFFARTENFPDKIRYIKMERLTPLKDKTNWPGLKMRPKKPTTHDWDYYNPHYMTVEKIIEVMYFNMVDDNLSKEKFKDQMSITLEKRLVIPSSKALDEMFEVYQIMCDLKKIFGYQGADYHAGNIMMRGDTVVITDPYADGKSMDLSDKLAWAMGKLADQLKKKGKGNSEIKKTKRVASGSAPWDHEMPVVKGPKTIKKDKP